MPKNPKIESGHRAFQPTVISMNRFEENESANSKPEDLANLDLPNEYPPFEVVEDDPTINLRSINTPDPMLRNNTPTNSLLGFWANNEPLISPGLPNFFLYRNPKF